MNLYSPYAPTDRLIPSATAFLDMKLAKLPADYTRWRDNALTELCNQVRDYLRLTFPLLIQRDRYPYTFSDYSEAAYRLADHADTRRALDKRKKDFSPSKDLKILRFMICRHIEAYNADRCGLWNQRYSFLDALAEGVWQRLDWNNLETRELCIYYAPIQDSYTSHVNRAPALIGDPEFDSYFGVYSRVVAVYKPDPADKRKVVLADCESDMPFSGGIERTNWSIVSPPLPSGRVRHLVTRDMIPQQLASCLSKVQLSSFKPSHSKSGQGRAHPC